MTSPHTRITPPTTSPHSPLSLQQFIGHKTTIVNRNWKPKLKSAKSAQQCPSFTNFGAVQPSHYRRPHGLASSPPGAPCPTMSQGQFYIKIAKLTMIPAKKLRKTRISPFNKKIGSLLGRMATMEEAESPTSEQSNQVVVTRARPQRANNRKATYVLSDDDSEDPTTIAVDLDSHAAEYSISDVADDDSDFN